MVKGRGKSLRMCNNKLRKLIKGERERERERWK